MNWEPPSRKRPLSAEEAELWAIAMREAKSLRRRGREQRRAEAELGAGEYAPPGSDPTPSSPPPPSERAKPETAGPARTGQRLAPLLKSPPSLAQFDQRQRRKLARDPDLIDARLDLHGMRQREAHGALKGFLFTCAGRGHRHVLVITGKGIRAAPERLRDHFIEERGVLRRLVPQWLGEPELRGMVVSYTAASAHHGGDGALYVRLRRSRGGV